MNMSTRKSACLRTMLSVFVLTLGFGVTTSARADEVELYATSFERPVFTNRAQLLDLDGWTTAIPSFLNPGAAAITNLAASDRKQSVIIRGAYLAGSCGITAPYDAVGSYRRPLDHTITADQSRVHFTADLLLETAQPATPGEFFSLTIAARSGDNDAETNDEKTLGEVGLSSQGNAEAFGFNVNPGDAPAFARPIRFNQWYRISMLLDYENRTTSYYVNGKSLGTVDWPHDFNSNILKRIALVAYARPDKDSNTGPNSKRSDYTARFDKVRVWADSAQD